MAAYANINNFMRVVRAANPTFERWVKSSLRPLIDVLNNPAGTPNQVCQAIAALQVVKVNRYIDALYYLLATYPGLPAHAATNLHLGPLLKTEAVRYQRTAMPGNFNPAGQQAGRVFVQPNPTTLGLTLEQYILANHANTGLLLIHLSDKEPGMERLFNGRSNLTHMASVLRVAVLKRCQVCVLTMDNKSDVCPVLRAEFSQAINPVRVYEPNKHMGSVHQAFRAFAAAHTNVVVMGFDAGICVFANVFGANETMPDGSFRPALASLTNVVMSRAGLVSNGEVTSTASPTMGAEYGPLFNT